MVLLWLQAFPSAKIVNGDKPILKIDETGVIAYGTPWMGKERRGENTKAPLEGLCFLQQSKVNSVSRLTLSETTSKLFTQLLLPTEEDTAEKTLELADFLVQRVPAWLLCCDISEEAVALSFEAMTGKSFNISKTKE